MARLRQTNCQMKNDESLMNANPGNPLTKTGKKVMRSMAKRYSPKKAKSVFYAMAHTKKGWHK